jgi:hypothetical protein
MPTRIDLFFCCDISNFVLQLGKKSMTRSTGAYLLTFRKGDKRQYYSILIPSPGKILELKNSAGKDQLPYTQLVFVRP